MIKKISLQTLSFKHKIIEQKYRWFASIYDFCLGAWYNHGLKKQANYINALAPSKILDVGIGTGLSMPFYDAKHQVLGIDLSAHMLGYAQQKIKGEHIKLKKIAFEDLPSNPLYDVITISSVLSLVDDLESFFKKVHHTCKQGGDVFIFNHFTPQRGVLRCLDFIMKPVGKLLGFHSVFEINNIVKYTGHFKVIRIEPIYLKGYWSIIHLKSK